MKYLTNIFTFATMYPVRCCKSDYRCKRIREETTNLIRRKDGCIPGTLKMQPVGRRIGKHLAGTADKNLISWIPWPAQRKMEYEMASVCGYGRVCVRGMGRHRAQRFARNARVAGRHARETWRSIETGQTTSFCCERKRGCVCWLRLARGKRRWENLDPENMIPAEVRRNSKRLRVYWIWSLFHALRIDV